MDSLGEILKKSREGHGYTIEKAAEETRIPLRFIQSIENDIYSDFPGEAYLKGFLRSYSQYLDLDPDQIVRKYEIIKISESEMPIEQLIPKPTFDYKTFLVRFLVIAILLGTIFGIYKGGVTLYGFIKRKSIEASTKEKKVKPVKQKKVVDKEVVKTTKPSTDFLLTNKTETFIIGLNGTVGFKIDDKDFHLKIVQLFPSVILQDERSKQYLLFHNYSENIDLNGDNKYDIEILLNNWTEQKANISFTNLSAVDQEIIESKEITSNTSGLIDSKLPEKKSSEIVDGKEVLGTVKDNSPITLSFVTKRDIYLRYKTDESSSIQGFLTTGTRRNISFSNSAVLWLSEGGSVEINIPKVDKTITPGKTGMVSVNKIAIEKRGEVFEVVSYNLK